MSLLVVCTINTKYVVVRQRSSSSVIWLMFSSVRLDRVGSACSLSLMTVRALSTGTMVNSTVTSYDTSFCPGGTSRFCSFPTNPLVLRGSFYIAQYPVHWTAKSALHFLPPLTDLFIPTPTRLLWLGSILARQQLRAKAKSLTFPPVSI